MEILTKMFGESPGSPMVDQRIAEIVAAQQVIGRRRNRVRVIRTAHRKVSDSPVLREVSSSTGALLDAVTASTGARVLVDASKRAVDAAVLAQLSSYDHYVLHLTRDPRAVAFSWRRSKQLPVADNGPERMARRPLTHSAARWVESNLACELLRRQVPVQRWLSMRYEDLVASPNDELGRLSSWLGVQIAPLVDGGRAVRLRTNHTVAGNPLRFTSGLVAIRPDDEWVHSMDARAKAVVTAMTLPLLLRYGYSVVARH